MPSTGVVGFPKDSCRPACRSRGITKGVAQARVPVLPGDTPETLAARVLQAEHKLYPQCVALACSGKARVAGERVRLQVREFGTDLLMNPHD